MFQCGKEIGKSPKRNALGAQAFEPEGLSDCCLCERNESSGASVSIVCVDGRDTGLQTGMTISGEGISQQTREKF